MNKNPKALKLIEQLHDNGKDLKQFIKMYVSFILDINKYLIFKDYQYLNIPPTYKINYTSTEFFKFLLGEIIKLNNLIKYDNQPKIMILSTLILLCKIEEE